MATLAQEDPEAGSGDAIGPPSLAIPLLVVAALLVLYVPVIAEYGPRYFWNEDENHAPVLLAMSAYAFHTDRQSFALRSSLGEAIAGALACAAALAAYLLGRVTDVVQLQGGSLSMMAMGLTLALGGRSQLRRWFLPCLLLVFIVPLVGGGADVLLVPLRLLVTDAAVAGAHLLGYPASANGVLISVGFVQLSVAGACVGLRSMVSMGAIAVLFLHFFPPRSWSAGLTFLIGAAGIALAANFIRVLVLVLVAGQFGAVAEAHVHDVAAYAEVLAAMGAFLLLARLTGDPARS